jgi:formylglycine-generating enzyme
VEKAKYKTDAERNGQSWGWNEAKGEFEEDPTRDPKYSWLSPGFAQTDDHPVVNVSYNDAMALCDWLSKEEGQTYRLPTEAEWEYSCRAGRASRYWSGDDPEGLATVGNVADGTLKSRYPACTSITAQDGFVFTAPVGGHRPNGFDLFDMHGNVWEWCSDWYDENYYAKSPPADPPGPSNGSEVRVWRSGSWFHAGNESRAAYRNWREPSYASSTLGLRLARVPSGK